MRHNILERLQKLERASSNVEQSLQEVSPALSSVGNQTDRKMKGFEVSMAQLQSKVNALDRIVRNGSGFKND